MPDLSEKVSLYFCSVLKQPQVFGILVVLPSNRGTTLEVACFMR